MTEELRRQSALADNRRLLDELTALAAELEAGAAGSLYRFGASRAYDEIVHTRLRIIGERKVGGLPTWSSFLARRMAPAIRTCATTEERQANLSRKLARAANLLRTRVDVELEQQNQELLKSMNARTRLQLRLQATVEGLSVAAISYYVVGLFGYVVKGAHDAGCRSIRHLRRRCSCRLQCSRSGGWCGESARAISGEMRDPYLSRRQRSAGKPMTAGEGRSPCTRSVSRFSREERMTTHIGGDSRAPTFTRATV